MNFHSDAFKHDLSYVSKGYNIIACIDEVGRGCLFGDVVSCAVVMDYSNEIEGIADSKKLSPKKREYLNEQIFSNVVAIGIGRVSSDIIDKINIKESTLLSMNKALDSLTDKNGITVVPNLVLVDAETISYNSCDVIPIINGDDISYGIGCASIVAKVYRDSLCIDWDKEYPGYLLSKNKGYGTKEHIEALKLLGYTDMHRKTFLNKIFSR